MKAYDDPLKEVSNTENDRLLANSIYSSNFLKYFCKKVRGIIIQLWKSSQRDYYTAIIKLTFEPLSGGSPARRAQSTAQLLEVNMAVSVFIEGEERALEGGPRQGWRQETTHTGGVQFASRRRVAKRPKAFL